MNRLGVAVVYICLMTGCSNIHWDPFTNTVYLDNEKKRIEHIDRMIGHTQEKIERLGSHIAHGEATKAEITMYSQEISELNELQDERRRITRSVAINDSN